MTSTILEPVNVNFNNEDLTSLLLECSYLRDELEYKNNDVKALFLRALESPNLTFKFKATLLEFMETINTSHQLYEIRTKLIYKGLTNQDETFNLINFQIEKNENILKSKFRFLYEIGNSIKFNNMSIEGFDTNNNYNFNIRN